MKDKKMRKLVQKIEALDRKRNRLLDELESAAAAYALLHPLSDGQHERILEAAGRGKPALCCDTGASQDITDDWYWQQRIRAAVYEGASCRVPTKQDYVSWRLAPTTFWSPYHDFRR